MAIFRVPEDEPGIGSQGWHYVRGVAFCNPCDQFSRKQGRVIALRRALRAIETRQNSDRIPKGKPVWILFYFFGMEYLSCYDAHRCTEYEKKIFEEGKR
ncbi:hypothetical protein ACFLWZ_08115 [Chloroflexota bacterium]